MTLSFNNLKWPPNKLLHRIWLGLLDYGRMDWARIQVHGRRQLEKLGSLILKFERRWCTNGVFTVMVRLVDGNQPPMVWWILSGPMQGFVFQMH
jgi:hypothetical protein